MESKKINQLATELAPDLSDLTIIGDPTTGISKKITLSQMASLFTGTVEEYANLAAFPLVGVADTIYIALDTNILYRWNTGTSAYVELSPNIVSSLVFNDANGFDGTINLVGSVATLTITTALTTGSVGFIGASGALLQDNANFFWDDTNNRLGLGTNAPTTALDVFGSGIIGRINGTSTNNAFLGFASAGTNKWSIGNVQSDHRFRIYNEATTSELVSVLSTGEFGIGIANPTTKLHIDGGATALIANLDANVSVAKSISFRSDNSNRINLEVSGTESGSNAGADLFIRRYSDAGALIDTPLTITRSTGAITLAGALSGTNASFSSTATATAFIPSGSTIPTNGMYLSAANTLNFATNTTNRLSISSTGVATFNSTISMGSTLTIGNQGGVDTTIITGGTGFGSKISLNSSGGVACQLTGNTDSFFNVFTGNVGVGTSTPAYKFDVSGTTRVTRLLVGGTATSRILQVNTSGNDGIRIQTSGDNPTLDMMQTAAANVNARNWRIVTNWEGWGTLDFQSGTTNTQDPATTRLSISGVSGAAIFYSTISMGSTLTIGNQGGVDTTVITGGSGFGSKIQWNSSGGVACQITGNTDSYFNLFTGNVGIGTSSPLFKFDCAGVIYSSGSGAALAFKRRDATVYWYLYANGGNMFIENTASGVIANINQATGVYTATSDINKKKDFEDSTIGLNSILALKPTLYRMKDEDETEEKHLGFIAQEVKEFIPQAYNESNNGENTFIGLTEMPIIAALVKGMQEQQAQIEELKALINK